MATERLAGATERLRRCVSLAVGVHSRMRIIAGPGFRGPCAGLGKACGHTAWWGWPIAGRSSRQCGALIWRGRCARTPQPGRYWRPGCSCGWVLDRGGRPRPAAAHHPAERGCGAGPVRDPRPGRSWRMGGRLLAPLADCGGGALRGSFTPRGRMRSAGRWHGGVLTCGWRRGWTTTPHTSLRIVLGGKVPSCGDELDWVRRLPARWSPRNGVAPHVGMPALSVGAGLGGCRLRTAGGGPARAWCHGRRAGGPRSSGTPGKCSGRRDGGGRGACLYRWQRHRRLRPSAGPGGLGGDPDGRGWPAGGGAVYGVQPAPKAELAADLRVAEGSVGPS